MRMDYQRILKLWEKNKSFIIENDRIKPKKYIYTPFFRANSYGFNNADIRRLVASDVMARFYRFTYNNVLFPTGYNTLANTAFIENRRLNDVADNISDIFNNQMLRLGIGINPNKDINMNSKEYISLLQQAFIDLYKKNYIKYDNCECYYDKSNNKIFDRINKPSELPINNIKTFYLDISSVINDLIKKIDNLDCEVKNEMINFLNPKEYLKITLSMSNGEELDIKMSDPELLGGISYILINPEHIDITHYIEPSEEESIIEFLNSDNGSDVVFTGLFAKNPLTGFDIPVFISPIYNESYHLGIPGVCDEDRELAISNELDIIEIMDGELLVESDFLSGYSREDARMMLIDAFLDAEMASVERVYEHNKILVSSLDSFGALFPFLEDKELNKIHSLEGYLPYAITDKLRAELDSSCDVIGMKMNGTINNLFIEGINPILSILYDDIGFVTSIFSNDAKKEYVNWNNIDYMCIKDNEFIYSLFMQIVFQTIIEKELNITFGNYSDIISTKNIIDNKGNEISKKNNNIIDFDKILNTYMSDSIRFYSLTSPLDEEFIFSNHSLFEIDEFTKRMHYLLLTDFNSRKLDYIINNLLLNCKEHLENKNVCEYIQEILEFFKYDIRGFNDEHALIISKLIYPICPFIAEEVYQKRFNGKYSIVNEEFV
jgi:leucyl-tRNA synthetase